MKRSQHDAKVRVCFAAKQEAKMAFGFTYEVQQLTPNQEMKRTLDRDLLSLPLQSAALKCRLS
ncbi:MAG: hypothetical protein R3E82_23305, partial [Pseudomonadales bacterium]